MISIILFKEGVFFFFKLLDKSNRGKYYIEIVVLFREIIEEIEYMESFDELLLDVISIFFWGLKEFELINLNERGEKIFKMVGEDFY